MSSEISTWQKTKDALLVGAAGLSVLLILTILAKVTNIEIQMAAYQADAKAIEKRVAELETSVKEHFKEDRERFAAVRR